jgi:hypothetical protein
MHKSIIFIKGSLLFLALLSFGFSIYLQRLSCTWEGIAKDYWSMVLSVLFAFMIPALLVVIATFVETETSEDKYNGS